MQTRTTPSPNPLATLTAALAVAINAGSAATAQNALGDGRALDNNLQQGRTVNPLGLNTNIAAEVAYRNALVTGNAANGMSFRESVGYNSVFDFRTDFDPASGRAIPLPSNETYNFRRDSLTSTYPSLGLRGIDAIREQAAWSTGNTYDETLNVPILRRAGVGQSGAQLSYEQRLIQEGYETTYIDPFRIRPRSLRSTTEHAIGTALETRILGQTIDEETNQVQYLQATPLRGVVSEMVVTENIIRLFDGKPIGAPDLISSAITQQPTDEQESFGYDAVVKRMSRQFHQRYAPDDAETEQTPGDNTEGATPDVSNTTDMTAPLNSTRHQAETNAGPDPLEQLRNRLLGITPPDDDENATGDAATPEALRSLFNRGASAEGDKINRLTPPVKHDRNLFAENMRLGESLLADARWFDAEERFSAALRLSPGDPMASIGRLHAQLGAGLYLSAGVNFDRLFRANPELMAAKYDERLLPRKGRLKRIDARLRLNAQRSDDQAISSALLMAYLAYQFDDRLTLEDAFAALDRIHAERNDEPDILETTLREVWLGL